MKNKLLFFSLLLMFSWMARAQETTVVTMDVTSTFLDGRHNALVRNWPGTQYSITCCLDDDGQNCIFRMLDAGTYLGGATVSPLPIREVALPSPLVHVSEFRVVDGNLFFGATDASSLVYFGYFDLTQLLSGPNVTFNYVHVDSDQPLHKIEGFKDSYGFKVYALGIRGTGSSFYYRIFEFDFSMGPMMYSFVDLPGTPPTSRDLVDDIVVLEDDVLFIGRDNYFSSTCCICIKKVSKTLGIGDLSIYNHYHFYNPNPAICEYNSVIQGKPLTGTKFAIAYTHSHSNVSNRRIRVFDNQPVELNAQEYSLADKLPMYEMAYTTGNESLTIDEPFGGPSRFVFIHPNLTSSYYALTMYNDAENFWSLDTISKNHYLSTSPRRWVLQYADQISYMPDVYTNMCLKDQPIKVDIPNKLVPGLVNYPILAPFPLSPTIIPLVSPANSNVIAVDCKSR